MPLFADRDLALRIEALVAGEMRQFVDVAAAIDPDAGSARLDVAGGVACYVGPDSPVNQASGLGLGGTVSAEEVYALERFYHERGAMGVVNACPLADSSLFAVLGARGWSAVTFENVLFRELDAAATVPAPDDHVEIRFAETAGQRARWGELVALGFVAPERPTEAERQLGRIKAVWPDGHFLLAYVDGQPAGTAELHVDGGVGWLSADTTLPEFRGRGVQRSLQRARLRIALEAGCDVAVSESSPGSGSQRNMERLGFRVAYTRTDLVLVGRPVA